MTLPQLTEVVALASRALEFLAGDGQVLAVAEGEAVTVTVTAVEDGRVASAAAIGADDEALMRAAKAAAVNARRMRATPAPPLPGPEAAPPPATEVVPHVVARIAVASTTGLRAAEERSAVNARTEAAQDDAGDPVAWDGDEAPTVVLGPEAVATVLDLLRPAFGVEAALGSTRLDDLRAAAGVTLTDDGSDPATLARTFDAEGVARRKVVLIEDGAACSAVHDASSAARAGTRSTGHATRPLTLAPLSENLLLAGGEAADVAELAETIICGLFIPYLSPARPHTTTGAVRIERGTITRAVAPLDLELDPFALLAAVEALTAGRRLVALRGHCPGGSGAATVPALRAGAGVRVLR